MAACLNHRGAGQTAAASHREAVDILKTNNAGNALKRSLSALLFLSDFELVFADRKRGTEITLLIVPSRLWSQVV